MKSKSDKSTRGNASQFFVAGELCRRGFAAVVTMGNTPNSDVLCTNIEGTKFVHIQCKTFDPQKSKTCSVGKKAEIDFGDAFFWVLCGIPSATSGSHFEYFIIPSRIMAHNVSQCHALWMRSPGKHGNMHNDNPVRVVTLPKQTGANGWNIEEYRNRWDLISEKLAP